MGVWISKNDVILRWKAFWFLGWLTSDIKTECKTSNTGASMVPPLWHCKTATQGVRAAAWPFISNQKWLWTSNTIQHGTGTIETINEDLHEWYMNHVWNILHTYKEEWPHTRHNFHSQTSIAWIKGAHYHIKYQNSTYWVAMLQIIESVNIRTKNKR